MILKFKQGDTYIVSCQLTDNDDQPINITNFTIRSQVRTPTDDLIAELTITKTDSELGMFDMEETDTQSWPVGCQFQDIEYTDGDGIIVSTQTFKIDVQQDITQ